MTPLEEKYKNDPKKVTKRTIQDIMKSGNLEGCRFEIDWVIDENTKSRKKLEKELIVEFMEANNQSRPTANRNMR